jgi:geranylgeranyl diphosphate synthase type II
MNINAEIEKLDWTREPKGLYEPIGYTLAAGGKRIRPRLALLGALAVGGKEQDVLPAALALEVFHNFTLLHDDVMDKAQVRRGRPTVHIKWNENTAILSGDQMMIEAYKLLSGVQADKLPKVLCLFNKMATEICEGQQYDVDFEQRNDVTLAEYMEMIRLKTSVLLATALQIGAYIGGGSEQQQHALYDYGINIGLAFQIQDDLLDCFGDPQTFGKAIGGDIREGKKTFMWLTARNIAGDTWTTDNKDVPTVLQEYEHLGVRKAAEEQIAALTQKALHSLELLHANQYTQELQSLAHQLSARTK